MRKLSTALSILLATPAISCSTFQRQAAVAPISVVEAKVEFCAKMDEKYYSKELRKIYKPMCYNFTNHEEGAGDRKEYLINLMMIADNVCAKELRQLSANQRTVNATLSTTSTILSSAATVVSGGLADNILSGGATLLGATRDHINAEVYRKSTPELITMLIQADRELYATKLLSENRKITEALAIKAAGEYHLKCSYFHGLSLLEQAASAKAEELNKMTSGLNKGQNENLDDEDRQNDEN
ncbi:hypothetical protein [Novosphingobium mangrovi (ex Hu et al. 2023)]|uniref:Lipoprotein n=1 Tax=Novosphingobium mangrovi (ex Hu et al. 2023) TaxID=2930094 RepID=A0ABT0AI49_9SPHN|nr:hypothetical protein [Novosphingobium mangrovi (ex Hu et al. 2023)]MCJ1962883.1 hypothetical protein [Novosphingobium mangrovi (ex Hu et al. 2023)]